VLNSIRVEGLEAGEFALWIFGRSSVVWAVGAGAESGVDCGVSGAASRVRRGARVPSRCREAWSGDSGACGEHASAWLPLGARVDAPARNGRTGRNDRWRVMEVLSFSEHAMAAGGDCAAGAEASFAVGGAGRSSEPSVLTRATRRCSGPGC